MESQQANRKPEWLDKRLDFSKCSQVKKLLRGLSLHSVCEEAMCPNIGECFHKKTATFMILGNLCTRDCKFCGIRKDKKPLPLDLNEPDNIAVAVQRLDLKYVVITSVTRDDLPDYGANQFKECIEKIKENNKNIPIEVLIPDFLLNKKCLETVVKAKPQVINHNIETVERLYPELRKKAEYKRSLRVLKMIKDIDPDIYTKSGLMVGLGEKEFELEETFSHLREAGCDFLSIGQYLRPSLGHYPVKRYYSPRDFNLFKKKALDYGFKHVQSSAYTRSSYKADDYFRYK